MFVRTGIASYNAQDHIFYGKGRFEGATLELGYFRRMEDYERYHGNAYTMIGIDEITGFPTWDMVDKLDSTLRSKNPNVKPIMRFTGNPGGPLHNVVKQKFVKPAPKGSRVLKLPDVNFKGRLIKGKTRMMVHSTVMDNPLLSSDDEYMRKLLSLPDELRKAWFEGCWDIAIGSFFGDVWDARDHVIGAIRPRDIPHNWEIRRAFDWGSSTPFCHLWYTISDGTELKDGRCYPRGSIIVLWEYYGQKPGAALNTGLKMTSSEVAQSIRRIEKDMGITDRTLPGPADNQIYANTDGRDSNLYKNFEEEGILFTRSNKSPGSAVVGWEQIRTRLRGRDGYPLIYFTDDCTNCISTIPDLARHETKPDDIADNQIDHCADSVKYLCLHHPIDTGWVQPMNFGSPLGGQTPIAEPDL